MLIVGDVRGLEWVTVNWLSQDPVGMQEILSNVDQHSDNQQAFNLPSRLIAKTLLFRIVYGGSEYSFCLDPDFNWISKRASFWKDKIGLFYDKYKGIKKQHTLWVQEATRTGKVVLPTGRFFPFAQKRSKRGEMEWPRTQILNYGVQGTGADIVALIRVLLRNKLRDKLDAGDYVLVSTVHDSIVVDVRSESLVQSVADCFAESSSGLPDAFSNLFHVPFNLPIEIELKVGPNMLHMEDLT